MMQAFGATVHPSPSDVTEYGRKLLAEDASNPGSLGIAISEAVEIAAQNPDIRYALGSVLNHVLMHQTVIGEEALLQLEKAGDTPDLIIGCTGGGRTSPGSLPVPAREARGSQPAIRAVEPPPARRSPGVSRTTSATGRLTPLMKMPRWARLHPRPHPAAGSAIRHEPPHRPLGWVIEAGIPSVLRRRGAFARPRARAGPGRPRPRGAVAGRCAARRPARRR